MPSRVIENDYWWYEEKGRGLPVVLLHGFPLDRRIWISQLDDLSAAARIITPDLAGFGRSRSGKPFTMESMADNLRELLKQLDALPCVLGGLSMGGYVSLAFARKYAGDLRGLMIINSKAEADNGPAREGRAKMIEMVKTQGPPAIAEAMFPKMLCQKTIDEQPKIANFVRSMMNACPALTVEHALAAMRDRPDSSELLANLTMPVHFIGGEFDAISPPDLVKAMQSRAPGSGMTIIQSAGHLTPLERPAEVTRAIAEFIATITP